MFTDILTQPSGGFLTAVIVALVAIALGSMKWYRRLGQSRLIQKQDGTFGVDQVRADRIAEIAKFQAERPRLHAVKGKLS